MMENEELEHYVNFAQTVVYYPDQSGGDLNCQAGWTMWGAQAAGSLFSAEGASWRLHVDGSLGENAVLPLSRRDQPFRD